MVTFLIWAVSTLSFEELTDSRSPRGVRYSLASILTLIVLAKLAGEDHPCGIAEWAALRASFGSVAKTASRL